MFRCQLCGAVAPARTPAHRVVVAARPVHYPPRRKANLVRRLVNGKHKDWFTDDPGGDGHSIAREVIACATCAARQGEPGS